MVEKNNALLCSANPDLWESGRKIVKFVVFVERVKTRFPRAVHFN
jgi:hypothetical protein